MIKRICRKIISYQVPGLAALLGFILFSCAIAPTHGLLYTYTQFPGTFNPANDVLPIRKAEGCQYSILGLIAFGNSEAGAIARNHEIRRIATIDYSFLGILFPLYGKFCTIVRGD